MRETLKRPAQFCIELIFAATMPLGARNFAIEAISSAEVDDSDVVVDLGCGPGTAARRAALRGARVIGVDPTPMMLSFARKLTPAAIADRIEWRDGIAEAIPLEDGEATVALAIRSAHHFDDQSEAFAEMRRVLAPGGRFAIVERALRGRRRLRGSHGLSAAAAADVAKDLADTGFVQVAVGKRPLRLGAAVIVRGVRP